MKVDLKGLSASEMAAWADAEGLEPYRAVQIRQWLFKKLASSFEEMTNLSKSLRALLKEETIIASFNLAEHQVSRDGTEKYLFALQDGHYIETVLIPERDHYTICISSQAGCAMGCRFCVTGKGGLKRNLTPSELVEQVIHVKRALAEPQRLTNIVLMGMGEPLANYEAVLKALENLVADDGMNFSHRKVTLSTCGLVPQMRNMGLDTRVNLAVSLNAADDKTRSLLMPINRQFPLKSLLDACRSFPLSNRRMITFEYVLIKGVNDRAEDARALADLLAGLRAKINLIALNSHPGLDVEPSSEETIMDFQQILVRKHYTAIIRKSKGQDIAAACGQLSGERV